jgi:hypothetical protein
MKRRFIGAFCVLSFTAAAFAHEQEELPIYPVHAMITVDADELNAVIDMQGTYLNEELQLDTYRAPLPATDWPAADVTAAEKYIENCFWLKVDGRLLTASSFVPRFVQEPLHAENSRFIFKLRYPLSKPGGLLSGHASFFSEYKDTLKSLPPDEDHVPAEFVTYLSVVGKETVRFELPLEKPDFSLSLDGMARPPWLRLLERARRISALVVSSPFFWIGFIFAIVWLVKKVKKRKSTA